MVGLLNALKHLFRLTSIVERVRAKRQREAKIEGVPQLTSASVLLVADTHRLVRIAQHPCPLRRPHLDERSQVEAREPHPSMRLLRIVEIEDALALIARFNELAEVVVGNRDRG